MTQMIKRLTIGILAYSAVFGVTVLGLEFFSKIYWESLPEKNSGKIAVLQMISKTGHAANQAIVAHPYSLFWNTPDYIDQDEIPQFNSLGHRSSELSSKKDDEYRILVLGGSTTISWPYIQDKNNTWPSILGTKLQNALNLNVSIINAGLPGGTTAELMTHYHLIAKYLEPDTVILHVGGNDIGALLYPNYQTDYSHIRRSRNGKRLKKSFRRALEKSYAIKVITTALFHADVYQTRPFPQSELDPEQAYERVIQTKAIAFEGNLRSILSDSSRKGINIVLVGFLQAREEMIAKNTPILKGLEKALVAGVNKHDFIMKNLAEEYDGIFVKLEQQRFPDDWFFDNCHLNVQGEKEKARQIFNAILAHFGASKRGPQIFQD